MFKMSLEIKINNGEQSLLNNMNGGKYRQDTQNKSVLLNNIKMLFKQINIGKEPITIKSLPCKI